MKYYFNIPHVKGLTVYPDDYEYVMDFPNTKVAQVFFDKKCEEHNVGGHRYLAYWCAESQKEAVRTLLSEDDGV